MPRSGATFDKSIPPKQRGRREATVVAQRQGCPVGLPKPVPDNPLKASRPLSLAFFPLW
jgi:hypothetical protein